MGKVIFNASVSLDGFVAGPHDEVDQLFRWYGSGDTEVPFPGPGMAFKVSRASAEHFRELWPTIGAMVTGRRNFDIAHAWNGNPPLGLPHVVVTHRVPSEWVKEGSPFTFVTTGIESAIERAMHLAGDKNVVISTANLMQQALRAELLDELHLDLVPVLLGAGIPLFGPLATGPVELENTGIVQGAGVTHLAYRVVKQARPVGQEEDRQSRSQR